MKRKKKIRTKIKGTGARPRLSVFRSNQTIYAQIINDEEGKTLVAVSEKELDKGAEEQKNPSRVRLDGGDKGTKTDRARLVGKILAQKALRKEIKTVVFDRRDCKYHGRVKALAEGARKGGLEF